MKTTSFVFHHSSFRLGNRFLTSPPDVNLPRTLGTLLLQTLLQKGPALVMWILLLALAAPGLLAQVDQGSITGTVTDSSGAILAGATVTATNVDTGLTFSRTTNGAGEYTFTPLKIGNYTLKVSAPGFEPLERSNIRVDVSDHVGLNMKLKPGNVSQTVEVTSEAPLQTEDASTGQVFTTSQLEDLPLLDRNYLFLAQLTTGVNAPNQGNTQTSGSGGFTSNGSRVSQNNFILDGVDNNSNLQDFLNGATYAVRPPPEALEEFKVQSSNYSAELGRSTGAAVNASIKAGTNTVHGSLWEYLRNDRLTALNYNFNAPTPETSTAYHENIFGATLGGPILKDKLFIFADAQGTRINVYQPQQTNLTVPTASVRTGDFSQYLNPALTNGNNAITLYKVGGNVTPNIGGTEAGKDPTRYLTCPSATPVYATAIPGQNVICPDSVDAVAKTILNLFPLPNQGVAGQVVQNYTAPATASQNNTTQYDVRVDYNFSSKDQAFGRYSYANNPSIYTPPLGVLDGGGYGSDGSDTNYAKSGLFSETHFFSPNLVNEFRVGYNFLHASYLSAGAQTDLAAKYGLGGIPFGPSLGGFPDLDFNGGGSNFGIGIPGYEPSDEKQDVIEFIDNVSKTWGRHSFTIGTNIQHTRFYGLQSANSTGYQGFKGTYTSDPGDTSGAITGAGLADFALDLENYAGLNSTTSVTDLRWYNAAYIQDDWKIRPNLTLNLGLRWEYTQPFIELHDNQANFDGNFAGMNQGSGTFLMPKSQSSYPIPAFLSTDFAKDNITIQYSPNRSLVNPDHHEFAPRLGFAYQPTARTVLRGGFGFFYGGQENIGLGLNLYNNPPFFLSSYYQPTPNQCYNTVATGVVCPTNGQTLETGFGAAATSNAGLEANAQLPTLFGQDQNAKSTYTESYNLSIQQSLTSTISFTLGYQGNVTRHLRVSYAANTYPGVVPAEGNSQFYQPFYDFGNIVEVTNEGEAAYDSLQAKLEKRFSHGLSFLAGYSWSHSLDDAVQPIQGTDGGEAGNPAFLGLKFEYGASVTDVRNRFTFSPQYELPFGKGKQFLNHGGVVDGLVGGWKATAIFQAQTGTPIALPQRFRVGDPFGAGGTPNPVTQPNQECATQVKTLAHWFNPCAFSQAPTAYATVADYDAAVAAGGNAVLLSQAGTLPYGQRGRLTVAGPGFNRLDMSLFKSFKLPYHEAAFELRADAINVMNTPSFGDPNNSITGGSAGQITSTRFNGLLPDARVIQVAGRLTF
jgi:Carboxypeptidase regulatory-like domain/TonB-dependent Receptor Plug Domain